MFSNLIESDERASARRKMFGKLGVIIPTPLFNYSMRNVGPRLEKSAAEKG